MLKDKYSQVVAQVVSSNGLVETNLISTGFKLLDSRLNGGLRFGCCYLFTGLEKSGKSSFLFNVINERLMDGKPTGLLSTEMECVDVTKRLASIAGLSNSSDKLFWQKQIETYFTFYGKDELTSSTSRGTKYDFPKFLDAIDEMESEGIDLVIVDNLTTLGAEAGDYKLLGNLTNQLITHTKDKKLAVIFVIHVKQDTTFRESPEGVRKMIRDGKPENIFTESMTIVNRPTLKDVYGGGQALSQISGAVLMIWRPFQKFDSARFQKMGMIVIDSHRFGPSCDIGLEYEGELGKFKLIAK